MQEEGQGGKLGNTIIGESSKGRGKPSKADGEVAVAEVGRKGNKGLVKVKRQREFGEMGGSQQFQ